jgi:hypothetical protein
MQSLGLTSTEISLTNKEINDYFGNQTYYLECEKKYR